MNTSSSPYHFVYSRGNYTATTPYYLQHPLYSHSDERCVKYWDEFQLIRSNYFQELLPQLKEQKENMQKQIDLKRDSEFQTQDLCTFSFDNTIKCTEFGTTVSGGSHDFKEYEVIGNTPILGCFQFYVNTIGFRNDVYTKDQLSSISTAFGVLSLLGLLPIFANLKNAWFKNKELNAVSSRLQDSKWTEYMKIPYRVLYICIFSTLFQLIIYSFMTAQFLDLGSYQLKHITLELTDNNNKIMFKFDYLEKTILILVCVVNVLWMPIFI